MMSRIGRSDYSRDRILAEESLLNLMARAGVDVSWVDNQSGCKGVCQGVPSSRPAITEKDCPEGAALIRPLLRVCARNSESPIRNERPFSFYIWRALTGRATTRILRRR
ncbi:hypothetical protein EVA_13890 [gut metagenome]|uniref:Uncharacterized protein n=1 Tax=gut metagenome TaxID=749906 RepID=J9G888_9ZZZZ